MEIRQFVWDVVDSNSWLITEGNDGLLIDAIDSEELYQEIMRLDSLTIILTHSHFDHICGLNMIRKIIPNIEVISTKQCSDNIGNKYKNMSSSATAFVVFYSGNNNIHVDPIICEASDITFENEYDFIWCGHNVKLSAFYGHSNDSLIAIFDGTFIFSGDTLLPIPTVTRFPGGSTERFWNEDVPKLRDLAGKVVYPGHKIPGLAENMLAVNVMPEKYK